MKGISFQRIGEVKTIELPDPAIESPDDAIVEVSLAGLCGSDLHPFHGREVGLDLGTVMGHEFVGKIVDLGDAAQTAGFRPGDRVFAPFSTNCGKCFYCVRGLTSRCEVGQLFGWRQDGLGLHGCQSEYVRVPLAAGTLKKLPDNVTDADALLLGDNFSTGFYCAQLANIQAESTCVVIGCGTVGQLAILAASRMKPRKIFAVDPVESRRSQAEELGAVAFAPGDAGLLSAVKEATEKRGADSVMELVGLPAAQELAYQLLRPGGAMAVIGCHCTPNFAFSPVDAYDKNLTYRTGRCPARFYMDELTSEVANGVYDLSGFVTHHFSINDSVRAYDVFSNRKDGCIKAAFDMRLN